METIPALVVEIQSKGDSSQYMATTIAGYLRACVRVVWSLDLKARTLTEHRSEKAAKIYHAADTVTLEDILPGLAINPATIFPA